MNNQTIRNKLNTSTTGNEVLKNIKSVLTEDQYERMKTLGIERLQRDTREDLQKLYDEVQNLLPSEQSEKNEDIQEIRTRIDGAFLSSGNESHAPDTGDRSP